MDENLKDFLCMFWGFIGGGIMFFLFINLDLGYVTTGSIVGIGLTLNKYFYWFGLGFVGLLFVILLGKKIKKKITKKYL